jgi:hypothetical protein
VEENVKGKKSMGIIIIIIMKWIKTNFLNTLCSLFNLMAVCRLEN